MPFEFAARRTCSFAPRLLAALVLMMGVAGLASCKKPPAAAPDAAKEPERIPPKGVARIYAKAVADGDMEAVRRVADGTDREYDFVKDLSKLVAASKRCNDASIAKFGARGKLPDDLVFDVARDVENGEEAITGDEATLTIKGRGVDRFKKDGNSWKLELSFLDKTDDAAHTSEGFVAMAEVYDTMTAEIQAGKFMEPDVAMSDLKDRLLKIAHNPANDPGQ